MKNIKNIIIFAVSNNKIIEESYELDIQDDSISILTKNQEEFLIIFKENINQIWYSSSISGASRFNIINLDYFKNIIKINYNINNTENLIELKNSNKKLENLLNQELKINFFNILKTHTL